MNLKLRDRDLLKKIYRNILGGAGENHEPLSHDSRSLGRDFSPRPPEYDVRVRTTLPSYSMCLYL